jgi:DNA-binding Xre family transcriptional regulator
MTKRALSEQMGVEPNTVYRWAVGLLDPGISKVEKMAAFLDCTPNDLVINPPQPPSPNGEATEAEPAA